ncbi:MAG: 30S ribosomal protein S9 [Candidatus Aenigmarchaeota archaeon]|nr:30S ribosomal protein S9 [Candidatus Aenigmarchaeota archaeon]
MGKRKKAVATAIIREGTGKFIINKKPFDAVEPRYMRLRLKEPVTIAGELANGIDITVRVKGGGVWGQIDAARTATANALVAWHKSDSLKNAYIDYDRSIMVSDSRRTEPHKPSRSTAGPRRSKQQSKR